MKVKGWFALIATGILALALATSCHKEHLRPHHVTGTANLGPIENIADFTRHRIIARSPLSKEFVRQRVNETDAIGSQLVMRDEADRDCTVNVYERDAEIVGIDVFSAATDDSIFVEIQRLHLKVPVRHFDSHEPMK